MQHIERERQETFNNWIIASNERKSGILQQKSDFTE